MKKLSLLIIALLSVVGIFADVLNEGFEGTVFPPAEWTRIGTSWSRITDNVYEGTAAARVGYNSGQHWLITPKLRPADGANSLTFWYRDHSDSSYWDYSDEYTYVKISTTSTATDDFTTTLWTGDYSTFTTTFQQASIDLSAYNGQDIYVAFHHVATGGNHRYFDSITGVNLAPPAVPNPATLVSPTNNGTQILPAATLNWSSGGGSPVGYYLHFGTSNPPDYIDNIGSVTTYNPDPDMLMNTVYYWQVVPWNAEGDAIDCPIWSFTTHNGQVALTAPADEASNQATTNLSFSWGTAPGASGYILQIGTSSGASDVAYLATTSPYVLAGPLTYNTTYYWSVFSVYPDDKGTIQSEERTFTTKADPILPLPYGQNFNASTTLPANWTQSSSSWSIDASHGRTGNGIYKNIYSYSPTGWFQTNPIGPITGNTKLSFHYRWLNYSGFPSSAFIPFEGDNIIVWISTDEGSSFTQLAEITGSNHVATTDWTEQEIWITQAKASAGDRIILKFEANWGTGDWYIDIDDITVEHISAEPVFRITPDSKNYSDTQIGTSSATQTFTISNNGGGTLQISSVEIVGDDADQFELTDNNEYPINLGLEAGSVESMQVTVRFSPETTGLKTASLKVVDDIESKTENLIPLSGTGFDAMVRTFPWIETFSSVSPQYWERYTGTLAESPELTQYISTDWTSYSQWNIGNFANVAANGNGARVNLYGTSCKYWFMTPPFDLGTGSNLELGFDLAFTAYSGTTPGLTGTDDKFAVLISTDGGTTWSSTNTLALWDNAGAARILNNVSNTGEYVALDLSAYSGVVKFAFYGESTASNADNYMHIDNVKIVYPNTQVSEGTAMVGEVSIGLHEITDTFNNEPLYPAVVIQTLSDPNATVTVTGGYGEESLPNAGLNLTFSGTNFAGATITITHDMGFVPIQIAYRIIPGDWNILTSGSPNILEWNEVRITFILDAKADGDVVVVFPQNGSQTLPVELSSFTAVLTADMFVNIAWVSESETNHSGYNILRNLTRDLDTAVCINSALIDEGTANGTQTSYLFTDKDVYNNNVYYYWLEIVALNGNIEYAGPITVTLGQPGTEPEVPEIPMTTKLLNAYPNPFNPQTNIRYSLKDAGQVQIEIFNLKGQKIRSYSNNHATAGFYSQMWDGKDTQGQVVGSGIYFYRMTSGKYSSTKKVMMMK